MHKIQLFKFNQRGELNRVRFTRPFKAMLTVDAIVAFIVAFLRFFEIDVPAEVAAALILIINFIIGIFTDHDQDQRLTTQDNANHNNVKDARN